ncbi:L,D-transpeptidase [Actinomadura macrotermitis]|uniref:L,D-transpeptidase 2 n=1 Tax=Actinomadura macrotermitis TaxID=2585200 RepID=A0A7K0BMU4_9ACTN|nr:Ig-like domain-containing protein [Actinomadura macrotermitis]MQY02498.1 L,D-transpeptidase 2 [Actinomadura macrotermitis]
MGVMVRVGGAAQTDRGRRATAMLLGVVVAAAAAACSGGGGNPAGGVELSLAPTDVAAVSPDSPITVRARRGTVENVTVTAKGEQVEGTLSPDRTRWDSRWTLVPGASYTVTATGLGSDGRTRTVSREFRTAKPAQTVATTIEAPFDKEVVGVGIPIILRFDKEVQDRAAVERALEVQAARPVEGAWHWFGNQSVVFRTRQYWPAHTAVSFRAHLSGVRLAKDTWGGRNYTVNFRTGDEHTSVAGEDSHVMVVHKNGKKIRSMPISMGRGGATKYTTTNGMHLTMEKDDPVVMDSSTVGCGPGCADYYRETVYAAVRISNSGEYVHSAPWSVGDQGNSNVSHGCINASPSDARWFYNFSYRGDPVRVTGTSRELEPENGWGYWQLGWQDWVKGSALGRSVTTGPANGNSAAAGLGDARGPA